MLTVNLIGGLGNQLFGLAFLEYASRICKEPIYISSLKSPVTVHNGKEYFKTIFKHWRQFYRRKKAVQIEEEHAFAYEDWLAKIRGVVHKPSEGIELCGYFQNYKYIPHDYVSKLSFDHKILSKYPDISNKIFIHIRGGDFLDGDFHKFDLTRYYRKCIRLCKDWCNNEFVVFTNDIPYAKKMVPGYPIIEESELDTLLLMSRCKGCICANSSFSWWGAYLNRKRPIFFPGKWVNNDDDTSGIYFPGSIIMPLT